MRNNEYTATPNWFKQESTDSLASVYLTNYYLTGSTSSGSGMSSINLYNKYIINTYRLTVDDLFIPNTAIIAVDSELPENLEPPEDFVSEIGNTVSAQNWYTSYSIRVISETTIKANLKANTLRYGIVFYDEHNTPISGYTPIEDGLVEISVPKTANCFKCCHYINPELELDSFYIEYQSTNIYSEDLLNKAYSGVFDDFTTINSSILEGITKSIVNSRTLNLIFLQPLQFTTDKIGNIRVELNNDVLKDTLLSTDYVTTIENDPLDILSLKDFKKGLKINGIEIVEKNGYVLIKGNLATTGGITAYTDDPDDPGDPGGSGGIGGSGTILDIEIKGEGNALINAYLNENKSILNFDRGYLMDLTTEQTSTALKTFTEGIKIGDTLIKVIDGVLTLDCSLAVTGGITAYALGEQIASSIMDAIICDGTTITVVDGKLTVIGGTGGASNWDELKGKPSWITDTKPTYAWGEITQKPATLSGYGIQAPDVLNVLKTVDGSGSGLDADTLDGYHLVIKGDGVGVKKTFFFPSTLQVSSYIKLGTLKTVAGTGNSSSKVMFTVRGGINYGGTNESVYEVAASTRRSIQVTSTLVRGNRELKFGYVSTSSNVEIWMAYDGTYRGTTEVEVSASSSFTITMTETTTKPSGFIEGSYRILAATTDNVASATKLQTARTIWGQRFDGTANVTGSLTSVTDITGTGTFTGANIKATDSVYVNGIRLHKTADNVITLEGNLAVTGGITQFAVNEVNPSTIMDGVVVDGTSIKKENGVLKVMNAGGGEAGSVKWANIEGKPTTLAGYSITASDVLSTLKTVDGIGSGLDADLLDGLDWNSFDLQRTYTINLSSYSSSNFYPVIFNQEYRELNCWINSPNVAGSATYNCNRIHFLYSTNGWSDFGSSLTMLSRHNYSDGEITIGSIGRGQKGGGCIAVWLRGGLSYTFRCNRTPNLKTSNYTISEETYTVGTGISGGTNSNVEIIWTNDSNRAKYDLATISSNVASATNADKLDGVHLNGIFTAFTASGNNTRLTIGGVTKDLTVPYASNSDKLDGVQLLQKGSTAGVMRSWARGTYTAVNQYFGNGVVVVIDPKPTDSNDLWENTTIFSVGDASVRNWQMAFGYGADVIKVRKNNDGWGSWKTLAFLDSNVASATKLQTARTIWGQRFDGTANVSGSLTGVTNITASGSISCGNLRTTDATINGALTVPYSAGSWISMATRTNIIQSKYNQTEASAHALFRVKSYSGNAVCFGGLGNEVGFYGFYKSRIDSGSNGTDWYTKWNTSNGTLAHKGNLLVTGGGTFYSSDIRAKTIIERPRLSLNSIANSPVIKFRWNGYNGLKDDNKLHVGGIAQYIEKILPECVIGQKDDFLSFDYATVGYVFSVQTARHLQSYETKTDREIKKLKNRITFLEKQLKKLGYEEVDTLVD